MGASALSIKLVVPFPIPAHQTRRADFPHRAFRPASSPGDRAASETFGSVWGLTVSEFQSRPWPSAFQSSDVFSETALFVTARVSRNSLLRPWPSARSAYLTVSEFQSSDVFSETALFVTARVSRNSLLRPWPSARSAYLNRLPPMSPSAASSTACRKSGPFARSALPGFNALMALSDSRCRPPSLPMALVYHAPPTLGLPL